MWFVLCVLSVAVTSRAHHQNEESANVGNLREQLYGNYYNWPLSTPSPETLYTTAPTISYGSQYKPVNGNEMSRPSYGKENSSPSDEESLLPEVDYEISLPAQANEPLISPPISKTFQIHQEHPSPGIGYEIKLPSEGNVPTISPDNETFPLHEERPLQEIGKISLPSYGNVALITSSSKDTFPPVKGPLSQDFDFKFSLSSHKDPLITSADKETLHLPEFGFETSLPSHSTYVSISSMDNETFPLHEGSPSPELGETSNPSHGNDPSIISTYKEVFPLDEEPLIPEFGYEIALPHGNKSSISPDNETFRLHEQPLQEYFNFTLPYEKSDTKQTVDLEPLVLDQLENHEDLCKLRFYEEINDIISKRTCNMAECKRTIRRLRRMDELKYRSERCVMESKKRHLRYTPEQIPYVEGTASEEFPQTNFDPCDTNNIEIPDFFSGRRISEAKCLEYAWNITIEADINNRKRECERRKKIKQFYTYYSRYPGNIGYPFIGGRPAVIEEFPHMGAIGWLGLNGEWLFKCGSSMISPKFVLTAAHCSKASALSTDLADLVPKIIRFSRTGKLEDYADVIYDAKIIRIIIHPNYKPPKKYFDIALMELDHEIKLSRALHPACLWTNPDTSHIVSRVTSAGWGVLKEESREFSPTLQVGEVDVIESRQCNSLLTKKFTRNWCGLLDHQICAGKLTGGVDACYGDSGGPLQVWSHRFIHTTILKEYHVLGVTSFGFGCARRNLPGVYTRVSSFIDWIEPIVWPSYF